MCYCRLRGSSSRQRKTGRDRVQQFASLSLMVKNYTAPLRLRGHGVVKVSSVSLTSLLTAIHKHNDISRLKVQSVKIHTQYLVTVLSLQGQLGFPVLLLMLCGTFSTFRALCGIVSQKTRVNIGAQGRGSFERWKLGYGCRVGVFFLDR